ncbi:hypothetical protein [Paenibacillus apiarius]|uniref:hypothetical protein n=1 Tax=Paenibacillus apiarius TaxID=46240 RepID=UPI003B3B1E16
MRKRQSCKVVSVIMMLALFFSVFTVPVSAESAPESREAFQPLTPETVNRFSVPAFPASLDMIAVDALIEQKGDNITIEPSFSTKSSYNVADALMNFNDTLTAEDPDDLWFFKVPSDRSMIMNLVSGNSAYVARLYLVDWNAGEAAATNVSVSAGHQISLKELPAGDYAIRVYSDGTVGDSYTIRMNAMNKANYSSLLHASASLLYVVAEYPDGAVYSNGVYVGTGKGENPHLDWKREFTNSWGSGYTHRSHNISSVKIKSISAPVKYSSSYASSDKAILIYVDQGTLFTYFVSAYQSGPNHEYENSFVDTMGKTTPRRIDGDDLESWGDHILVYDLNENKAIDFFSVLNFYYASGVEAIPAITYLN